MSHVDAAVTSRGGGPAGRAGAAGPADVERWSTREQVAIAAPDPTLSMDDLVADHVRAHFGFRVAEAADYSTALATENAIKAGALSAGPPRLNPPRNRRRAA